MKQCSGCGMPVANAFVPESTLAKQRSKPKCPSCRSNNATVLEADRWMCATCGSIYETPDMGYVDDRPEQNAMKKERTR